MDQQERPNFLGIRLLAVEEDDDWGLERPLYRVGFHRR